MLARDIEDHPENQTRFVVVGHGIPARTGHDKTTIVCFQRADRPGSLLAMLQEFAARRSTSRSSSPGPTKKSLGDYCFVIDIEGHIGDELVADCLRTLAAKVAHVKFLGSYPVAGRNSSNWLCSVPFFGSVRSCYSSAISDQTARARARRRGC